MEHPLPMWVFDIASLRFLDVNTAALRAYGYSREQFLQMTLRDLQPCADLPALPYLAGALDAAALPAAGSSEDMLRSVSDQLPDVVFVKDVEGRYVFVNQASAALLGRPVEEIIGRLDSDFSSAQATAAFRAADAAAMSAAEPTVVHEWVSYGGREAFMQTRKAAWRDEQGTVRGVIGIARDLTALKRAERELHDMQLRYRIAFEHAPIGMALAAVPSGRWLYANEAMCQITGYSAEELSQLGFRQLTHPDDMADTLAQLDQLVSDEQKSVQITKRYVRKDGSILWARRTGSLVRDEQGQPHYLIVQVQDITREHEVESRLLESERRYRLLFESMADGVIAMDVQGRVTMANPAAARIMCMTQEELGDAYLFDRKWEFLQPDGSHFPVAELPGEVARRERREVRDVVIGIRNREDGSERWINVSSMPQFQPGETEPYQVLTTFSDVTHVRAAERALLVHEERFRALVENSSELVFILGCDGSFSFASESFSRVLGYEPDELLELNGFLLVHPDDRDYARRIIDQAVAQPSELVTCQLRGVHKSGTWRMFEAVVRSMLDHPAVNGVVLNARDITDRWLAEQTLQQREAELRQAQKMEAVGRLAGGIAHDFNNVLTAISGHAEFLAESVAATDPAHADVDGIRTAADRAARLTAQLLAFSRTQLMQPTELDLRAIVLEMRMMLQRLIGEDMVLECDVGETPALVLADRTQIEQVLLNLTLNARDAMPTGGALKLHVEVADLTSLRAPQKLEIPVGMYVVLTVEDTGEGIRADIVDKIFEPFFTTKARGQGSGLGLSTVYGIVQQSNGYVYFDTTPGAGTRFRVLLPLHESAQSVQARSDAARTHDGGGVETVLLVEDEASVRNMAERVLRRQGYCVLTAANGAEALAMMEQQSSAVDVVVTDVVMPEMSGPALAAELTHRFPDTAIIFMSGYTDNEIDEEGIRAAEAAFLPKPFTPHELAQRVRAVLRQQAVQ